MLQFDCPFFSTKAKKYCYMWWLNYVNLITPVENARNNNLEER